MEFDDQKQEESLPPAREEAPEPKEIPLGRPDKLNKDNLSQLSGSQKSTTKLKPKKGK